MGDLSREETRKKREQRAVAGERDDGQVKRASLQSDFPLPTPQDLLMQEPQPPTHSSHATSFPSARNDANQPLPPPRVSSRSSSSAANGPSLGPLARNSITTPTNHTSTCTNALRSARSNTSASSSALVNIPRQLYAARQARASHPRYASRPRPRIVAPTTVASGARCARTASR